MTSRAGAPGNHPRQSRPSVLHSPPVSRRRRVAILAACTVAMLVAQIDSTGVNLALPSVARDLRATTGELQWIVDSYLLVLASLLMFSGALADRAGRRRVFVSGLLIFGLGSALWGKIFAAICIVSVGVTVVMVQTNSLAQVITATVPSVSGWMVGVFLVLLTAPVVLGGVRLVARVAEWLAPVMALAYVLMAVVVIVLNADKLLEVLVSIFEGAFGVNQAFFGTAGGVLAALLNGVRRGLFSNEAGLGTVPNAAGTATVAHPVRQGLIQSFGVFVDTILVCTATGLLILLATDTYHPGDDSLVGAILTQQAVAEHLGAWTTWPMVVLIFVLVFSTVLGCYSYAQVNVNFLGGERRSEQIFGIVLTAAAFGGTVLTLPVVWALSDIALGLLGVLNLVVIVRLAPWVIGALRDFESQRARGITEPAFVGHGNSLLPGDVVPGIWEPDDVAKRG